MSEDELDERLAHKLRRAAEAQAALEDEAPLDLAAQSRVLAELQRWSQERERARRTKRGVFIGAVALAASVALGLWLREVPVAAPPETALACALPVSLATTHFASRDGRQLLSLGSFGRIAATSDSQLTVSSASACELVITLAHGTLAAELQNLRPAKLSIRTPLGEVQVRGTTFSVRVDGSLEVALLKGAVDVVTQSGAAEGAATTKLTPGHLLQKRRAAKAEIARVSPGDERAIATLIDPLSLSAADAAPATVVSPPVVEAKRELPRKLVSTAELLGAAEAARRAGKLDQARSGYRQAGTRKDADAEVALLRWTRLELSAAQPAAARDVLQLYRRQFPHGRLAAEASSLELRALESLGRHDEAAAVARELIRRFPDSPHAKAARRELAP